jgi:hypothetical protein
LAEHCAETVAAVAHRQQGQRVCRSGRLPASRHGCGRCGRGERAFELVWDNQDVESHASL